MRIEDHYQDIVRQVSEKAVACGRCPDEVSLITVTKTRPIESIQSVYGQGARDFGENRLQEALEKIPYLPSDCRWHFIGTLQSNKIGKVLSYFDLIHSVDSFVLAEKISQASLGKGCITSILLQVNTSGERTKHGLSGEEWEQVLEAVNSLSHIRIEGLMTMAPYTSDQAMIRACFRKLYQLREAWHGRMRDPAAFRHLSMGMSNDYLIAIEEGATLLRIGSAIFESNLI